MENPHAMLQRSIKFSAFFVMIRKIIILSEQKMGPLQFFFYSLFYVDTNFLILINHKRQDHVHALIAKTDS